jgi:hypothetical protein
MENGLQLLIFGKSMGTSNMLNYEEYIELEQEYEQDNKREFLKKQIEFINPEIIINSHRINKFISDQIEENNIIKIHGERFGFNNSRLIIDTSHPNTIGYSNKNYCNNILSIIANNY